MKQSEVKRIWEVLGGQKGFFILFFSFGLPLSAIKSYQAYLVKPIFDKGLKPDTSFESIQEIVITLLALSFVYYFFRYFQGWGLRNTSEKIAGNLREKLFKKYLKLPLSRYQDTQGAHLINVALSDVTFYANIIQDVFIAAKEILTVIGLLTVTFYHSFELALICLGIVPLYVLIFKVLGGKISQRGSEVRNLYSSVSNEILQSLEGRKVARALNIESYLLKRFHILQEKILEHYRKIILLKENASPFTEFLGLVLFSVILIFGYLKIQSGEMTPGALISFISSMALIVDPVRNLTKSVIKFKTWSSCGDRIYALLLEEEEIVPEKSILKGQLENVIEARNLAYQIFDAKILKNVHFKIKKGEKVAFVGGSGAGKSTAINILLGFYRDYQGEVFIDGKDIKKMSLNEQRSYFSFVSQDTSIFNDTLKKNIVLNEDFDEEKFNWALEKSLCCDFIDDLEDGVDTILGDRATKVSGGQAQRVSLARALYRDSSVLILDEATSALDNVLDSKVQNNILSLENKTVISIAHKLNTIQNYNSIYMFQEGGIIEQGSHEELLKKEGLYMNLYQYHS